MKEQYAYLEEGLQLVATAKAMSELYEREFKTVSKYVHATSRGHEAIQVATGLQLTERDYLSAYYRDDALLLAIGMTPKELMLQLLAKRDDPFSGGRTYYSHPSLNREGMVKIPHQSSATGMQAIPTTGVALGLHYQHRMGDIQHEDAIVVCSLGDASITEGEVAEAFQMAALKQLPIIYLVQDNEWDISATADEIRSGDAMDYIAGFKGIEAVSVDGSDYMACYQTMKTVVDTVRREQRPFLVHAKVPLLNHHTSGVRMEWYRDDLEDDKKHDPYPVLIDQVKTHLGLSEEAIDEMTKSIEADVEAQYQSAVASEDPRPEDLFTHDFAPGGIAVEVGERTPAGKEEIVMVDAALFAIKEIMADDDRCLLYGQDVGGRLGGVFREAATLAQTFGDHRVFNTPIQEAFIIGSTVGMSAVGLKPIVEVQFADYIWPGLNQLFTEVSRSCYLSNGQWPVSMILRVPIGAYGSGGPYHSSSVESVVTNIRGIKVAYPSNAADLKGLMKSAYDDPNPVVIFEHKGLYWSKVPGTQAARTVEPSADYRVPFGHARIALAADSSEEASLCVITYGMGVHWALNAAGDHDGRIEIIDLRTLHPLDMDTVITHVKKHHRALVITEEPVDNSLAQSIAARIQDRCFEWLDAPVRVIGAENMPAIPLNEVLERTMLPDVEKVSDAMGALLRY